MASLAEQSVPELGGAVSVLTRQKRDHVKLDRLLRELGATDPARQDRVLRRIYRLVFPHAFAEESVLWPAIRRELPDGEALTLRIEREHQEVNDLVTALDQMPPSAPDRPQTLARLVTVLNEDVRDEEDLLLPRLQEAVDPARLRRLGVAWEVVRRVAPTRAHPIVSRRPPGNVLAAIPLAVLDRIRDGVDFVRQHEPPPEGAPVDGSQPSARSRGPADRAAPAAAPGGGGGALIAISSVESIVSLPLHAAYSASKHAVEGAIDALRRDLMADKTPNSVTSVKPARINTPLFTNSRNKLEVKPKGPPPIYRPEVVARCVVYAAEHPVRDLFAGGSGPMMAVNQFLAPRQMDRYLSRIGVRQERTKDPALVGALGNLTAPSADDRVHGDFRRRARPSLYTWMQTHPRTRATAFMLVGPVVARRLRGRAWRLRTRSGRWVTPVVVRRW